MSKYNGLPSFGGFFPDNIRKSIIKDCLESGDPGSFLSVLIDVLDDLTDEWSGPHMSTNEDEFWNKLADEIGWGE